MSIVQRNGIVVNYEGIKVYSVMLLNTIHFMYAASHGVRMNTTTTTLIVIAPMIILLYTFPLIS